MAKSERTEERSCPQTTLALEWKPNIRRNQVEARVVCDWCGEVLALILADAVDLKYAGKAWTAETDAHDCEAPPPSSAEKEEAAGLRLIREETQSKLV